MTRLYRMLDAAPNGVFPVKDLAEAKTWNDQGYGVFATVNEFHGARRIENLVRIKTWAVDLDEGTKDEQLDKIDACPLIPSRVVETKNGYHVHWFAADGTAATWNAIVLDRLVPYFGADKNARDIARILRVPGFWHQKDPAAPFMVRRVLAQDVEYTERIMLDTFEDVGGDERRAQEHERERRKAAREYAAREAGRSANSGESFWEAAIALDCADALERLSGHWLVSGEQFELRPCRDGNRNIYVDGKGTSCFVDSSGRIGSSDGGGPSIVRWCAWYRHSYREIARGLSEVFPHLADIGKRRAA